MIVRDCPDCAWWSQSFISEAEAATAEVLHRRRHHGDPTPVTQMPSVVGWQQALDAARTLAATGAEFTLADLPDVENHRTSKGKLAAEIHRLNIAHPIGYAPSRRKATNGSAVKVWHEDRARCIECPRLVVPA